MCVSEGPLTNEWTDEFILFQADWIAELEKYLRKIESVVYLFHLINGKNDNVCARLSNNILQQSSNYVRSKQICTYAEFAKIFAASTISLKSLSQIDTAILPTSNPQSGKIS